MAGGARGANFGDGSVTNVSNRGCHSSGSSHSLSLPMGEDFLRSGKAARAKGQHNPGQHDGLVAAQPSPLRAPMGT